MPRRKNWKWYIHGDTEANRIIASRFDESECAYQIKKCADGVRRDLWELPIEFVDLMVHDRHRFGVRVSVYVDRGNGEIHCIPWGEVLEALKLVS
jgi:hypothetical protein